MIGGAAGGPPPPTALATAQLLVLGARLGARASGAQAAIATARPRAALLLKRNSLLGGGRGWVLLGGRSTARGSLLGGVNANDCLGALPTSSERDSLICN